MVEKKKKKKEEKKKIVFEEPKPLPAPAPKQEVPPVEAPPEVLPPKPEVERAPITPPAEKPGIFTSAETGEVTGIRLPDGRVFFGTSEEIAEIQRDRGLEGLPKVSQPEAPSPERVELDVKKQPIEELPLVGPAGGGVESILTNAAKRGWMGKKFKDFLNTRAGQQTLIQNPETLREIGLQEIQKEVIKEGISIGEDFGTLVELIPFVGSLARKYASGLIETPSANADTIVQNILNEKERALNTAEMVRSGRLDTLTAEDRLDGIEDNIVRLEQRLKLLIDASPILRADPDEVNRMETEILRTKERITDARTSALRGKIREPADAEIYLEIERLKGGE